MMLLLLLLPLFSKIVIVEIKLLWLWGGVAGMLDRQLCTRTSSQPSTMRISMPFPYCHNSQVHITMRLILSWSWGPWWHETHTGMRHILSEVPCWHDAHATKFIMSWPWSCCHMVNANMQGSMFPRLSFCHTIYHANIRLRLPWFLVTC